MLVQAGSCIVTGLQPEILALTQKPVSRNAIVKAFMVGSVKELNASASTATHLMQNWHTGPRFIENLLPNLRWINKKNSISFFSFVVRDNNFILLLLVNYPRRSYVLIVLG